MHKYAISKMNKLDYEVPYYLMIMVVRYIEYPI